MHPVSPLTSAVPLASTICRHPEQLSQMLLQHQEQPPERLGQALVAMGALSMGQLEQALQAQTHRGLPLGQLLLEQGLIDASVLQAAVIRQLGHPEVDLDGFGIDAEAVARISLVLANRLQVVPVMHWQGMLVVAMADPLHAETCETVAFASGCRVWPVAAEAGSIRRHIARVYRAAGQGESVYRQLSGGLGAGLLPSPVVGSDALDTYLLAAELSGNRTPSPEPEERSLEEQATDSTLVRLVHSIITEAYRQGASDIHIEPYPGQEKLLVRFRVDGLLHPCLDLPAAHRDALIARIKVMARLDIAERRRPQDGKIDFARFGGPAIELRVTTIPTAQGLEDVVMRLLVSAQPMSLTDLGLSSDLLASFQELLQRPHGLFLCVGPTGSGKTTTLHAALHQLNQPTRKLWTAEDPVEITQPGLRQIQVHPRIGWTFAAALRSLLRADPDVIMVGEIRDRETADMCIEAALTGHLVLSTLHTNSATDTLLRLQELGVDPMVLSDVLQGVLAQRLVRRLCARCAEPVPDAASEWAQQSGRFVEAWASCGMASAVQSWQREWAADQPVRRQALSRMRRPRGCPECRHTGFRSRVAVHEWLSVGPTLRQALQQRPGPQALQAVALGAGMRTLRQDGILKVWQGLTSWQEVEASCHT